MQISGVIKFGAPMYNKGDARGCARLYRQTALSIARDASVTSEEIRSCNRDAVAKADEIARKAAEEDPMGGEEDQRDAGTRRVGAPDAASTASWTSSWTRPWTNPPSTAHPTKTTQLATTTTTPRPKTKPRRRERPRSTPRLPRSSTLRRRPISRDDGDRSNDGVMGGVATGGCARDRDRAIATPRVRGDGPAGEQRQGSPSVRASFGSGSTSRSSRGSTWTSDPGTGERGEGVPAHRQGRHFSA